MNEVGIRIMIGYVVIVFGWMYRQASEMAGGIIDRGFDAGLSIGLLIVGLLILGWYHWKYQQYSRELVRKLASDKDKRAEDFHALVLRQNELSNDQIQTNKELTRAVRDLSRKIGN